MSDSISRKEIRMLPTVQVLGLLNTANEYTVMGAIDELVARREPLAVAALTALLLTQQDAWILASAAQALGELAQIGLPEAKTKQVVAALLKLIQEPASTVADLPFVIAESDAPLAAYAGAKLLHEMDDVRFAAVKALGLIDSSVVNGCGSS